MAVIAFAPSARVLSVTAALPFKMVELPITVPFEEKITTPVGVPLVEECTATVRVTPVDAGTVADDRVSVSVEAAGEIARGLPVSAEDPEKLESPL